MYVRSKTLYVLHTPLPNRFFVPPSINMIPERKKHVAIKLYVQPIYTFSSTVALS